MPYYPPSITDDQMMTAVRSFLLSILPGGTEVIQAQSNRVPEPVGPNFVLMTPRRRARLATNVVSWPLDDPAPVELAHARSTEVLVQLDIHGPNGADYAQTIATLWRDPFACDALKPFDIQPLFANDGNQLPFQNSEHQWEDRWVMEIVFQAVPSVSTPQDFAATLDADIIPPVDLQGES